jgi:hypothetical protein
MKRNMLTRKEGPLIIVRQTSKEATNQDWDEFLRILAAQRREFDAKQLKVLVYTDGSVPNAQQRKRLADTLGPAYHPLVACISNSVTVRFASALIALFQRNYRQFVVSETTLAFTHLKLSPAQREYATRVLEELEGLLQAQESP